LADSPYARFIIRFIQYCHSIHCPCQF
jgi:hypothetical protein